MKKITLLFTLFILLAATSQIKAENPQGPDKGWKSFKAEESKYRLSKAIKAKAGTENPAQLDSIIFQRNPGDKNYLKQEYQFDGNDNALLFTQYLWDETSNEWEGDIKEEYTYNAQDEPSLIFVYEWDTDIQDWGAIYKANFSYNDEGRQILMEVYDWSNNPVSKTESSYEIKDGNLFRTDIEYISDPSVNTPWLTESKIETTYDENENEILSIEYSWEYDDNSWQPITKIESTYDENGNEILYVESTWDYSLDDWDYESKGEYVYGEDDQTLSAKIYYWNYNMGYWVHHLNMTCYYSTYTGIEPVINEAAVSVFPNPASDYIKISLPDNSVSDIVVGIYDISGRKLLEQTTLTGNPVMINSLTTGMYFYQVKSEGKTYKGKLLVN